MTFTPRLSSERVNFWTHLIPFFLWIPLGVLLLLRSGGRADLILVSLVYSLSAMFLFFASANYHYRKAEENQVSMSRKIDHMAIFVMIAGSYTPVSWIWYEDPWRWVVIGLQWGLTLFGVGYKLLLARPPRWIAPLIYVAMGWVAVGAIVPLSQVMPPAVFASMLIGGLLYTAGALIYAIKKPNPLPGVLGFHEIFHLFIVAGAGVHYGMQLLSIDAAVL